MHKLVLIKLGHVTTKYGRFGSFKDPHIMDHLSPLVLLSWLLHTTIILSLYPFYSTLNKNKSQTCTKQKVKILY